MRPFWPFSERWYSWDIVFIVEPVMLGFLFLGLVVPGLFALVDKEIGARAGGPRGRLAASLALIGVALMWGIRDYEHRRAVNAQNARTYKGAIRSGFRLIHTGLRLSRGMEWRKHRPFLDWHRSISCSRGRSCGQTRNPPQAKETGITLAAKKSYLGRVYLDWAQYPITETQTLSEGGYIVHFQDLRYVRLASALGRGRKAQATFRWSEA